MSKYIISVPKEKLIEYLEKENICCFCGKHISDKKYYSVHQWLGNVFFVVCSDCGNKVKKDLCNSEMKYLIDVKGSK